MKTLWLCFLSLSLVSATSFECQEILVEDMCDSYVGATLNGVYTKVKDCGEDGQGADKSRSIYFSEQTLQYIFWSNELESYVLGQYCGFDDEGGFGPFAHTVNTGIMSTEPFPEPSLSFNWKCWDDVSESYKLNGVPPSITCTKFNEEHACPMGTFSSSGFEPCTPCPSDIPHTLSFGSTSDADCITFNENLIAVSQNLNKILSYSPEENTWDILIEESEYMLGPRNVVWISPTNFLVTSFFLHEVNEFRMDGTFVGTFAKVDEPEGLLYIPPPFNMIAVTSLVDEFLRIFLFPLEKGINGGSLDTNSNSVEKIFFTTEGLPSTGSPLALAYHESTFEIYATTWSGRIERRCLPDSLLTPLGLSCNPDRQGRIAYNTNSDWYPLSSILLIPEEDKFVVPCTINRIEMNTICKCPIPDALPAQPFRLDQGCDEVPVPKVGASPVGNGYFDPSSFHSNSEKNLLFVTDSAYSRVYVFHLRGTSSFIRRLETKSGYLAFPVALSSRPGLLPAFSSFLTPENITVGELSNFPIFLKDGNDENYDATDLEIDNIKIRAIGSIMIGMESVNLEIEGSPIFISETGQSTMNIKFTLAGTYELAIYQEFAGEHHMFRNAPMTIKVNPGPTQLSMSYSVYDMPKEAVAGVPFRVFMLPRDLFGNPTIGSTENEQFFGKFKMEGAKDTAVVMFSEVDDEGPDDDSYSDKPEDKPSNEPSDLPSDTANSGKNQGPNSEETAGTLQALITIEEAGYFPLMISRNGKSGDYTVVTRLDVIPAPPDLTKTLLRVNNYYLDAAVVHSLEYESTTADATVTIVVEPFDEFDNVVSDDSEFHIEVDVGADEVLSFDLEPPQYTQVLVVEKGKEATMGIAFFHASQAIEGGSVKVTVSKTEELLNTNLLLVIIISSISAAIVSYAFYRKFLRVTDNASLKSETSEVKENVFSIGMDFFDVASDVVNYFHLAQFCDDFLVYYQVFMGTAAISFLLVVSVNIHQLFVLVAKGNIVHDEEMTKELRMKLMNWKKMDGKDHKGRHSIMAVGGIFKRRATVQDNISKAENKISVDDKKAAMLQSLNDRIEWMNELLILNRRILRSKVGMAVVVFEDIPLTLLNVFIMINGCGTDNEGNVTKLQFFFLASTIVTAALSMKRIVRFMEIQSTQRRVHQIALLIDYKYAEAELFVRNENLLGEAEDGKLLIERYNSSRMHTKPSTTRPGGIALQTFSEKSERLETEASAKFIGPN